MTLAESLAKQQRSISVAEFFEKNKHLLGFDSPTRGIITTIKEAVDNALDACEEAEVLPDIYVAIKKTGRDVFRIIVEDNGPGIVPENISKANIGMVDSEGEVRNQLGTVLGFVDAQGIAYNRLRKGVGSVEGIHGLTIIGGAARLLLFRGKR